MFYLVTYILDNKMNTRHFIDFIDVCYFCITINEQGGKIISVGDDCGQCYFTRI